MAKLSGQEREIFIHMLKRLDMEGLREVHQLLKVSGDLVQRRMKLEFCRGDIVEFTARGEEHTGTVAQLLRKRVRVFETVETSHGQTVVTWRISPGLLRIVSRRP